MLGEPGDWDELTLWAATVFLEAAAEPPEGKLAVAWVIRNRLDLAKSSVHRVILGPEGRAYDDGRPWEVFSCWNDDYRRQAEARLAGASPPTEAVIQSWRVAAGALWRLIPTPVEGAIYYLNVPLTLKIRGGRLPTWAAMPDDATQLNPAKVVGQIGKHHFLRA